MRVLFTTTPGRGHWSAMTPLAEARRERGHQVLWATAPAACAELRERGWGAVSAGLPAGATSNDLATPHEATLEILHDLVVRRHRPDLIPHAQRGRRVAA